MSSDKKGLEMTMTKTNKVTTTVLEMTWTELAQVASIAASAGTDEARPILTKIHLTSEDGKLQAVATDSYTLAIISTDVVAPEGLDVLVPAKWLVSVVKQLKITRYPKVKVTLSFTGENLTASNGETTVSTVLIDAGLHLQLLRLVPAADKYTSELGAFNAEFLARMADILPAGRKDTTTYWKCLSMSATSPSLWTRTYESMSAKFLIMPVKVS